MTPSLQPLDFIRANTELLAPPLIPEIRLHLASELVPLWQATEEDLATQGVPPPYWAFAWVGGQALARYLLDHPEVVRGKRVLDFAAGSGLQGIAAAKAGAASVTAAEIDAFAAAALALNAAANAVTLDILLEDVIGRAGDAWDLVLAGDVCYERSMAERVWTWLQALAAAGRPVLIGDPGRTYMPRRGLERITAYAVPTSKEIEDREVRDATVWRVLPPG